MTNYIFFGPALTPEAWDFEAQLPRDNIFEQFLKPFVNIKISYAFLGNTES